jgi:hypothetical protein
MRFFLTRFLSLLLAISVLVGCRGVDPVTRDVPSNDESRVALEFGSFTLYGEEPKNIVLFMHVIDENNAQVSSLTQHPYGTYITMYPGDRHDIQQSFISVPVSQAESTTVTVSIIAVPDNINAVIMGGITSIILEEITNKIPGQAFIARGITAVVSDSVSHRIQAEVEGGLLIGMCEYVLNTDGPPQSECTEPAQDFDIAMRSVLGPPTAVYHTNVVSSDANSPIEVFAPSSSSSEDQVINVIRRFNADQTRAMRDLELDILRPTSAGQWLEWQEIYMNELINQNLYEVQQQQDFEVLSVTVSEDEAQVITRETWRTAKYDRTTNACRYHQPQFTTQQTYTLVRERGNWKIIRDVFEPRAPADIPGC